MSMSFASRNVSDVMVVDLSGRFWLHDIQLRDHINELLDGGSRHFVLNLADVTFTESSGLGQMVAIWTSVTNRGGRVSLLRPADQIRKALKLTKLDKVFDVFEDEAEAVGRMRSESGPSKRVIPTGL